MVHNSPIYFKRFNKNVLTLYYLNIFMIMC